MNLHNNEPIDPRDLKLDKMLANLQGNILKGHGRDNTVHILVEFYIDSMSKVKAWINKFAEGKLTCFKEQLRQREVFKRNNVSGGLFSGIYLTADFYRDFGYSLEGFSEAFKEGMKSRSGLNDDVEKFEAPYQDKKFHAMILMAHADVIELNMDSLEICKCFDLDGEKPDLKSIGKIITIEYGSAIRNSNRDGLEHFGYVDGISQPLFLKEDMDEYLSQNIQPVRYDPLASLDLVLIPDPLSQTEDAYGSYFVYRKLEQDVRGFKLHEKKLAKELDLKEEDEERVGAMIVGRFEDGTPLTLSGTDKMISSGIMNNFDYKEEIDNVSEDNGQRCPFHAHIRKTNPRRSPEDLTHRMARRGITYGHRNVSTTVENHLVQMPTSGVGLLFMSFQKSIENQFEFIQTNWANNKNFENEKTGIDLIIGQTKSVADQNNDPRLCGYTKKYNKAKKEWHSFENFVTTRGGEYFFAPSIDFLKKI